MSKKWGLWIFLSLFLPSIIILGIHAYLGSFNRYIADDFCSAYFAERLGILRSVWFWYLSWFGRYSASLADSILPLIGIRGLTLAVLVILTLWLAVAILAAAAFWPDKSSRKDRTLAAVSLGTAAVFVTLLISPNVPQSLYWWGGMRAYIPPLVGTALYAVLYKQFTAKDRNGKEGYGWLAVSFLVPFASGGFSETFTPVQVAFFVFIVGWGLIVKKYNPKSPIFLFLLSGLLGALVALFVMVLAPGNAHRQAFFPESHNVFTILNIAFTGYVAFLKDITGTPDKIAGLAGLGMAAIWLGMQIPAGQRPKSWAASASLFLGFVFAFGCFPSAAYGLSDVPPARALIIPAYFLVISLIISGFLFGRWWSALVGNMPGLSINLVFCTSVMVLMSFSAWSNGQTLYSSRQMYIDYARQWDQMDAQIRQVKKSGVQLVIIPAIPNWAGLDSLNDNPKFWVTYCYSNYYGIDVRAPDVSQ
ncbi:MAG TPA: DUF6056 family protein [Anaerolineales bacterium]